MSKAHQAQALMEASSIGADAAQVICEVVESLSEVKGKVPKVLLTELTTAAAAMNIASKQTKDNTFGIGGIGTSYAAERLACAKRRKFVEEARFDKNKCEQLTFRPALMNIENIVHEHEHCSTPARHHHKDTSTSEMGRKKRSGSKFSPQSPIPAPDDGRCYSSLEAAKLLAEGVPGLKTNELIHHMISNNLVPVSKTQLYLIRTKYLEKLPISPWGVDGRPPCATIEELHKVLEQRLANGQTVSQDEMQAEIWKLRLEKATHRGMTPSSAKKPNNRTVRNYISLGAAFDTVRTTECAVFKTEVREVAENSIISALTFAGTVAATHFLPVSQGLSSIFILCFFPLRSPSDVDR
jgi:hypothetical protein